MVRVAIMGASGAVGQEMLKTLERRQFPATSVKLLASARSVGKKFPYRGRLLEVEELTRTSFDDVDIVLASAGGSVSKEFAPIAARAGAVVVDNTSAFRMEPDVPLVVPEVNAHATEKHKGIIANPNCSTIQMVVVLKPIYDVAGIKRVVVSTYQAVSGAGGTAMQECIDQTRALLSGADPATLTKKKFAHQIAFNALPHIDVFLENGYTKEEMKMVNETHKIMEDDSIGVTATTVRVPVLRGHSESVNVETRRPLSAEECRELLGKAPGVVVIDDPKKNEYPLAIYAEGRFETFVGRIRKDES
ncbi:MAG: aspartate-semialdehyde dehydrogenase, partial [bacterium]